MPLFVSRRTMPKRKEYQPLGMWALDSGGYSELSMYGGWCTSETEYLREVERWREWPGFQWAAPMDWMTEPHVTAKTGMTVAQHQRLTVENFVRLDASMPSTFIPVLQGQTVDDYLCHARWYADAGVDVAARSTVGLGSVCRRQDTGEIEDIMLALQPLRLHGFGCKRGALERVGYLLASADSMAWSYAGRMNGSCEPHGCGNHMHYAMTWRNAVLRDGPRQLHLLRDRTEIGMRKGGKQ